MQWIQMHYNDLLAVLGGAVAAVSALVKLTATEKDDTLWAKALGVLAALSLVNPDGSVVGKRK